MHNSHWPLFGLAVQTPRVTLRYPDDDDLVAVVELAAQGIHPRDTMPFSIPWTDVEPPMLQRQSLQHLWGTRARWSSDDWSLPMVVIVDSEIVGIQDLFAKDFAVLRVTHTGSWLGRSHQGKGIGTEMRAAILHLAFAGLGASGTESGAFVDNPASLAVSRHLGYEENGRQLIARRGAPAWLVGLRLSRERWETTRRDDVAIKGLDACIDMFGVA
jgi:RimJ/RimL family protein N-acetyltransferase